jgi:predicted DNA-binding antitoxin AbrB/MazE fold protein
VWTPPPRGAQSERRGDAGPVRLLLAGEARPPMLSELLCPTHPTRFLLQFPQQRPIFAEVYPMAITIEAVYENGVLKPAQPLPFKEREKVQITVMSAPSRVRQSAGLMGWTGSQEDADFVASSPELDPQESA